MSTQNTLYRDFCKAENSEDEDNNTDLQSRLYAEIYYAPNGQENMNAKGNLKQETIDRNETLQNNANKLSCPSSTSSLNPKVSFNFPDPHSNTNTNMQSYSKSHRDVKPNITLETGQTDQTSLSPSVNSTVTQNLSNVGITQIKRDLDANVSPQGDPVGESATNQATGSNTNRSSIKSETEIQNQEEFKPIPVLLSTPITLNAIPNPSTSSNVCHSNTDSNPVEVTKAKNIDTKKVQENDKILEKYQFSKTFMQDLYTQKYQQIHQTFHQDDTERKPQRQQSMKSQNVEDDTEMDTKYNVNFKKTKAKQEPTDETEDVTVICDSDSDSEDSILEVPIPPKPKPPVINLNDSDGNISSDSDSDVPVRKKKKHEEQKEVVTTACKKSNKGQPVRETSHHSRTAKDSDCIVSVPDEDILLNCTGIQKGASSLKEIKEMGKDAQSQHSFCAESIMRANRMQGYNESLGSKSNPFLCAIENVSAHNIPGQGNERMGGNNIVGRKRRHEDDSSEATAAKQSKNANVIEQHSAPTPSGATSEDQKREQTWEEYIFKPMSRQMKAFYNESRGQENFNINELQSQMSKDPRLWAILDDDLRPNASRKHRFWNVKCNNCHRDGHQKYNCPEPRRPPVCHMCGGEGHTESRCPQKMCLTCGKKQGTFRKTCESCQTMYCNMCRSIGHKSTECPDLWRRFHQTTRTTKMNIPDNLSVVMKPADLLYCCNCTRRGHDASTCKEYRWSPHFPTPSYVSDYTGGPGYMNPPVPVPQSGDVLLFYNRKSNRADTQKVAFQPDEVNEEIATIIHTFGTFYALKQNGHEIKRCISQSKEYHINGLLDGAVYPTFLEKLYKIIQFQVLIYYDPHENIMLRIRAHLMFAKILYKFVVHWLHLEEDEKDAMVVDLPRTKEEMIDFLKPRIISYQQPCKDPGEVVAQIKECKREMLCTKNQSILYNRQRRVYSLKLEFLRYYHVKSRESAIGKKLKNRFEVLPQSNEFDTNPIEYLYIVFYYNKLFVPHTPPDMDAFVKRHCKSKKGPRKAVSKKYAPPKTFNELVASLQGLDQNEAEEFEERTASPENRTPNRSKGKKAQAANEKKQKKAKKPKKSKREKEKEKERAAAKLSMHPPAKHIQFTSNEFDFSSGPLFRENLQPVQNTVGFIEAQPPERIQKPQNEKNVSETTKKAQSAFTTRYLTVVPITRQQVSRKVPKKSGSSGSKYTKPDVIDLEPEPFSRTQNVGKSMKGSHTVASNPEYQQSKDNITNSDVAPKKKKSKKKKGGNEKPSNNVQSNNTNPGGCSTAESIGNDGIIIRARTVINDALAFQLPYLNKAAMEVDKRLRNKNIKKKHIDVLEKLVVLEKNHQRNVHTAYNAFG